MSIAYQSDAELAHSPQKLLGLSAPRPVLPVTELAPCAFAGTLQAAGNLAFGSLGAVARIERYVDVTRLEVPATEGLPRASLSWPIEGEFELPGPSPFVSRKRLELTLGHVWFEPGQRVRARRDDAGRVAVSYQLPTDQFEPRALQADLTCSDLSLGQEPADREPKALRAELPGLEPGAVAVAARPKGPVLATIDGRYYPQVRVLGRQGGFAHVVADGEFGLDGWVTSRMVSEGYGTFGLSGSTPREPPATGLEVVAPLPLRLSPRDAAPVLGRLPVGQRLSLTSERERYVGFRIAGARATNETAEFFALRSEVEAAIGRPGALRAE